MEEKKLKPLRLKIRSNGIRHLVIAEDEYLIEGVKRIDIEMPPLEAAMVNIQVYLKDIDLELCGAEQNSNEGKITVMRGLINESNESEDEIKKNEFYKTEWETEDTHSESTLRAIRELRKELAESNRYYQEARERMLEKPKNQTYLGNSNSDESL